jgi:hypothetical protein
MTTSGGFTAVVAATANPLVFNPPAAVPDHNEACDLAPKGDERIIPPWAA